MNTEDQLRLCTASISHLPFTQPVSGSQGVGQSLPSQLTAAGLSSEFQNEGEQGTSQLILRQATDITSATRSIQPSGLTSLLASSSPPGTLSLSLSTGSTVKNREWVIVKIERIIEKQVDSLLNWKLPMQLGLSSRPAARYDHEDALFIRHEEHSLAYPGSVPEVAWRYAVVIRILELIHEALTSGQTITKRDIYYRDPNLFTKQTVVDRYLDHLASKLGVPRVLLNVTAAAKGLVAGSLIIRNADGSTADARVDHEGLLIPNLTNNDRVDAAGAQWILVVEKEATFHSLTASSLWKNWKHHVVLITAKGYPDVATRTLLHILSVETECPILALVDFDPDGLDILSTYKHGSHALIHEKDGLTVKSMIWLGLKSDHVQGIGGINDEQGLLRLSLRDRHKAIRMLEREPFASGGREPEWRRCIQTMLALNMKAEIQLLEARAGGLADWVQEHLVGHYAS